MLCAKRKTHSHSGEWVLKKLNLMLGRRSLARMDVYGRATTTRVTHNDPHLARVHHLNLNSSFSFPRLSTEQQLVSPLRFLQNNSKAASGEAEALFNTASHCHFASVTRNAKALAEYPHSSGTIVNLENSVAHCPKGTGSTTGNGDFLAGVTAWVFIDVCDTGTSWASSDAHDDQPQSYSHRESEFQ
jgi:hypothetical protein